MSGAIAAGGLSNPERQAVTERLYGLLARQTAMYLAGDGTSVPVETAEELLRSLVFTLRLALSETGRTERALPNCDLAALLRDGQRLLQRKLADTKRLWEQACLTAPQLPNAYLRDTLRGLGDFFARYELRYFAHQIPCAMDYPLCLAVPEEPPGVLYVEQWLRRLLIENRFLSLFSPQAVGALLSRIAADYWSFPLNLCEQPLIQAVGLAMLEKPVYALALSEKDCRALSEALFGGGDMSRTLERGVARAADELHAPQEAADYLRAVVSGILPRLQAASASRDVRGVFLPAAG